MRIFLALLLAAAACGDDDGHDHDHFDGAVGQPDGAGPGGPDGAGPGGPDGAAGGGFAVDGVVTGTPPAGAKVLVLWEVTSAADYLYKYGEGESSGAAFALSLPGDPPAEALNQSGGGSLGVGILVLVRSDLVVPDGVVDDSIEAELLG